MKEKRVKIVEEKTGLYRYVYFQDEVSLSDLQARLSEFLAKFGSGFATLIYLVWCANSVDEVVELAKAYDVIITIKEG